MGAYATVPVESSTTERLLLRKALSTLGWGLLLSLLPPMATWGDGRSTLNVTGILGALFVLVGIRNTADADRREDLTIQRRLLTALVTAVLAAQVLAVFPEVNTAATLVGIAGSTAFLVLLQPYLRALLRGMGADELLPMWRLATLVVAPIAGVLGIGACGLVVLDASGRVDLPLHSNVGLAVVLLGVLAVAVVLAMAWRRTRGWLTDGDIRR